MCDLGINGSLSEYAFFAQGRTQKVMYAEWQKPTLKEPTLHIDNHGSILVFWAL